MKGLKCVAIVGKQNEPLLVRCAEFGMDEEKRRDSIIEHSDAASGAYMDFQEEALKFHYFVHTALDIVDEKTAAKSANSKIPASLYLGLLCPIENMKVYGYISNTKIKFLAVVDDSSIKDSQMKHFFSDLHALYVQYISNPFVEPYSELPQDAFDQFILPNFL